MDNLGVWVYIIFILIAVYSTYRKAKKQIKTASRPLTPAIEPIEEESDSEYYDPVNEFDFQSFSTPAAPPKVDIPPKDKFTRITIKPYEVDDIYQEHDPYNSDADNYFENASDLRKAVITSEILARKF